MYREFLIDSKIAIYKGFEKISPNCNTDKNKTITKNVLRLLLESMSMGKSVLFFDETCFQPTSLRKKAWGNKNKRLIYTSTASYPNVKILATLSLKTIESIQLYKKVNGQTIAKFLEDTITVYCQKIRKLR